MIAITMSNARQITIYRRVFLEMECAALWFRLLLEDLSFLDLLDCGFAAGIASSNDGLRFDSSN